MGRLQPYVERLDPGAPARIVTKPRSESWSKTWERARQARANIIMIQSGEHLMDRGDRVWEADWLEDEPLYIFGWHAILNYGLDHTDRLTYKNNNAWDYALGVENPNTWLEGFVVQNSFYGIWQSEPYVHWEWVGVVNCAADAFKGHPGDMGVVSYNVWCREVGVHRPYLGAEHNHPESPNEMGSMSHVAYPHWHQNPSAKYRFIHLLAWDAQGNLVRLNGEDADHLERLVEGEYWQGVNVRGAIADFAGGVLDALVDKVVWVFDWDLLGREWYPWVRNDDGSLKLDDEGNKIYAPPPPYDGKPWFMHGDNREWPETWRWCDPKKVPDNVFFINRQGPRMFHMTSSARNKFPDVTIWLDPQASWIKTALHWGQSLDEKFGGHIYPSSNEFAITISDHPIPFTVQYDTESLRIPPDDFPPYLANTQVIVNMEQPEIIYPPAGPDSPPEEDIPSVDRMKEDLQFTAWSMERLIRDFEERYGVELRVDVRDQYSSGLRHVDDEAPPDVTRRVEVYPLFAYPEKPITPWDEK